MPASLDPQLALDERALNAPDLKAALERRLRAQDDVAEARGVYKTAHAEVQAELEKLAGKRAPVDPDGKSHFATCPQADAWRKHG